MKKLLPIFGYLFIISGVIFFLAHSFLVTGSSNEDFARDFFGFPIPHPPVWTSYIPFIGSFLGFIFEFFSIHGLIGVTLTGVLLYIGGLFVGLSGKEMHD